MKLQEFAVCLPYKSMAFCHKAEKAILFSMAYLQKRDYAVRNEICICPWRGTGSVLFDRGKRKTVTFRNLSKTSQNDLACIFILLNRSKVLVYNSIKIMSHMETLYENRSNL